MTRVELPSGGWAEILPVKAVSMRSRGLLSRTGAMQAQPMAKMLRIVEIDEAMEAAREAGNDTEVERLAREVLDVDLTEEEMELVDRFQVASVVALVARWSSPNPPTMDSVQDLPADDYDALQKVCGPLAMQVLSGVRVTPDDVEDPASPTEPSNGSAAAWRDETSTAPTTQPQQQPTTTSPTAGSSTGTAF